MKKKVSVRVTALLCQGNYARIAREAHITSSHVSRVLRGTKGASLHVAARIAHAAGVPLDEMYTYISAQATLNIQGRRTVGDRRTGKK